MCLVYSFLSQSQSLSYQKEEENHFNHISISDSCLIFLFFFPCPFPFPFSLCLVCFCYVATRARVVIFFLRFIKLHQTRLAIYFTRLDLHLLYSSLVFLKRIQMISTRSIQECHHLHQSSDFRLNHHLRNRFINYFSLFPFCLPTSLK